MEIYDEAHVLARNLRHSDVFRKLLQAEDSLLKDQDNWDELQDIRDRQLQLTAEQLAGKTIPEDKLQALNNMTQALLMNDTVREYLQAEERFAQLLSDVQKIISQVVQDVKMLSGDRQTKQDR